MLGFVEVESWYSGAEKLGELEETRLGDSTVAAEIHRGLQEFQRERRRLRARRLDRRVVDKGLTGAKELVQEENSIGQGVGGR